MALDTDHVVLRSGTWQVHRTRVTDLPADEPPEEWVVLRLWGSAHSKLRLPGPLPADLPTEELTALADQLRSRELDLEGTLWECVATGQPGGFVLQEKNGRAVGKGSLPEGLTLETARDAELELAIQRILTVEGPPTAL